MITDGQVLELRRWLDKGFSLAASARMSGMDEKTGRKYRDDERLPSQRKKPRDYRTRVDPFETVWPEVRGPLGGRTASQSQDAFRVAAGKVSGAVSQFDPANLRAAGGPMAESVRAGKAGDVRAGASSGPVGRQRLYGPERSRRADRRAKVRSYVVSLRVDVLEHRVRFPLLFRIVRGLERGDSESLLGVRRRAPKASHRQLDRSGQQSFGSKNAHPALPGVDGALRSQTGENQCAVCERERRCGILEWPFQKPGRSSVASAREPGFFESRRLCAFLGRIDRQGEPTSSKTLCRRTRVFDEVAGLSPGYR